MSKTPMAPLFHQLSRVITALILGLVMGSKTAAAEILAWVQLVGPGRDASIGMSATALGKACGHN